jgi:type II secretory pathway pseudopilin PulG
MLSMQRRDERGFTIMELVVAMAFLGIVIVTLMNLFTSVRQINRAANNYTIAVQVAQQLLEKYRNTAYGNITTGTTDVTSSALSAYPSLLAPRSATTAVAYVTSTGGSAASDVGFKKVDVAISYKDRTGTRQVQFSTIIGSRGLNR